MHDEETLLRRSIRLSHNAMRFSLLSLCLLLSYPCTAQSDPGGNVHSKGYRGSPYVPLDSWIYPALKRLAGLGYVVDQVSDSAPWTRAECLRQTREAATQASTVESTTKLAAVNQEALHLIAGLSAELDGEDSEGRSFRLESLYTRVTGISGTPLRDSYHFGQTISDDYGRPYDKGFNDVTGLSSYATGGPFFAYFRGEYQDAPGRDADPLEVREFIAGVDHNPLQGPNAVAATNRFEPLEMYAGVKLGFETITFGKQNLWWGPGEYSAFDFSDNAEPFYMLRLSQSRPFVLPGILAKLGKMRTEFIFGKLSGHLWPPDVYMNAQKLTVDVTKYLEVGITRSDFFGGVGHPMTLGLIGASLFGVSSTGDGTMKDPGDRHGGFDFRYRVPGLRRYLTIYTDSYADDTIRRLALGPGIYLSQIPGIRRFDFRCETYTTEMFNKDIGPYYFYYNNAYHDSYTNKGTLLGSWIGRDSRAYVASTTYWVSPKSKVQAEYRQVKAGTQFLPGGGTQTDGSITAQWGLNREWMVGASVQYERYYIPVLGGPERDLVGSLSVVFTPRNWGR
jgi:capsule assembly protein Wzi